MAMTTFAVAEAKRALDRAISEWEAAGRDLQAARVAANGLADEGSLRDIQAAAILSSVSMFAETAIRSANMCGLAARTLTHGFDATADGDDVLMGVMEVGEDGDVSFPSLDNVLDHNPEDRRRRDFDGGYGDDE